MKKYLLIIFMFVFAWLTSFSQNVTKQCTLGAVYYSCGATTAYQSEQGPWFDLVVNGNQNNGYQAYGIDWATWKEYDNGTAQLTGRLYQIINKVNVKFDMNFTFSNKGAGTPHGGGDGWHCIPSSTSDWSYYNSMSGTLTGVSGTQAAGINFTAQIVNGTSLQIGTGGSTNSPIKYGMSAWLHLTQTGGWNQCWNKGGGTDLYFDLNNCTTPCSNFTSGGAICCDQTGCSPFNPTIINNQTSPTGGSGAIEYIWLKSITASTYTTANASQWQTITGATGASYDPDAISQTTWYIRCARRSGCVNYTGESNIVKITVTSPCVTPPTTCVVRTVSNGQSICSSNVYGFWYNSVFYTVGTGMTFTENSDGTAKLVGTFVKTGETVAVNVTFTGRTTTAPLNSPKYGNCINSGGTSWYYYSAFTGTLQFSTGANISISQSGPAFQVGYGANLNDNTFGAAAWFKNSAGAQVGDFNFRLSEIGTACTTCNNLTSGGSIGSNQSGCSPYTSTMINNIVLPSGGDATKAIEYVWLKTTDPNGSTNLPTCDGNGVVNLKSWVEIAGANAASYNPGTVNQTTWYLRCARRAGCVCYYGESNLVKITITGACPTCNNLTSGGSIGSDQSGCLPYLATMINSIVLPSGGDATKAIEYVWLKTTDPNGLTNLPTCDGNGVVNLKSWVEIAGANASSYNPGVVNQTTWYLRCARRVGCVCYYGESNLVKITITGACNTCTTTSTPNVVLHYNLNACSAGTSFSEFTPTITTGCLAAATASTFSSNSGSHSCAPGYSSLGVCAQASTSNSYSSSIYNKAFTFNTTLTPTSGSNAKLSTLTFYQRSTNPAYFSNGTTSSNNRLTKLAVRIKTGTTVLFEKTDVPVSSSSWQAITLDLSSVATLNFATATTFTVEIGAYAPYYVYSNNYIFDIDEIKLSAACITPTTLTASISGNRSVCIGKMATLTASPSGVGFTYKWSNGATTQSINVTAGTYSLTVTNAAGCTATTTATVAEIPNPTVSVSGNLVVCNSGTTTLTASGGNTYAWSNGATSASVNVTTGTYTVTATSSAGCTAIKSVTVSTSQAQANITGNLSVCAGATTTLTASGGGTYKWNNGATTQSITVGTGTYSVTITNSTGCTATATATVVNTTVSVRITGNLSVCTGATTLLTASGNGTYKWSNGATSQSIAVGAGTYSVTLTNADGCTAVATTTVVTSLVPQTNITGNLLVCTGSTTLLTASGIGTYKWSNGATSQSITVGAGTYSVTVTNSAGCTATATATVVNSAANVSITGSLLVCTGATTQLTANGTGTYKWSNGATTQSITVGVGTYSVTLTTATGCTAVNSAVVTTKDCNTSSIGDLVFCDKNGNGTQDAGEPGIPNVTIYLTGTATNGQSVNLVKTTDANGKYLFSNLPAGTYKLTVVKPTGYLATVQDFGSNDAIDSDINPSTGMTNNISLGVNETNLTVDAGFYQLGSIGDFVFNDTNKNGIQDAGEIGIPNVTVVLNGIMNGISVTYVTSTDASGKYNFPNLLPGTYTITFTKPAGYNASPMDQGDDTKDSDANPTTGTTSTIILTGGQNNTTIDAGFYKPTLNIISIGDFVFLDCNKNGIQDVGEQGLAGVTITLKNASGAVVTSTTSGVNGAYSFNNITEGTYSLTFSIAQNLAGFAFTAQNQGTNDAIDSDVNTNGETGLITFTTTNTTVDAGVMDIGAPVINNVPADVTVDCGSLPSIPSNITATDNYDTAPSISMITSTTPLAGQNQYLLKRTWTATDKCGNKSTKTWTICVKDAQAPVFLNLPPSVTVECNAIPPAVYPGVKDNCDLKIPVSLSQTIIAGNCPDNYIIKRLYTANDDAGNAVTYVQYVTVQDTKAPVLTGVPADVTILCGQTIPSPPAPGVVKATDNCDANVTITFSEVYYAGNCNGVGVIKCQWTATDNCGNTTAKIWTITIDSNASSFIQNTNNNSIVLPMAITRSVLENESVVNENVVIYPNPTSGEFMIDLGDVQASRLNITNEMGQILYTVEQPKNKVQVNLNASQKGLHTVQIFTSKGILTKKVVVIE